MIFAYYNVFFYGSMSFDVIRRFVLSYDLQFEIYFDQIECQCQFDN